MLKLADEINIKIKSAIKPVILTCVILPPIKNPNKVSKAPPKVKLNPVAATGFVCFAESLVNIPPNAAQKELKTSIPSPLKDIPEKKLLGESRFIITTPKNPRIHPITFPVDILSSLKTIHESMISIKVPSESSIAEREPGRFETPK